MSFRFSYNPQKSLEALLYVVNRCNSLYSVLKVLYFADKDHLSKYGRFIAGESYVAMKHGPVPSGAYDMVKFVRGDRYPFFDDGGLNLIASFRVENGIEIFPLREARNELLSDSDRECLDRAIERYGTLPFGELREQSHDEAYEAADCNDFISVEAIVQTLPEADLLLEHLQGR